METDLRKGKFGIFTFIDHDAWLSEMHISPEGDELALAMSIGDAGDNQLHNQIIQIPLDAQTKELQPNLAVTNEFSAVSRPFYWTDNHFNHKLKQSIQSLDYSPEQNYLYFVEKTNSNPKWSKKSNLKREDITDATTNPENLYTYSQLQYKTEIRRAVDDELYINNAPGYYTASGPAQSWLQNWGDLDNPNGPSNLTALNLQNGNSNYGMPLQPYRVYEEWNQQITTYESQRAISNRSYEITDHLSNVRAVVSNTRTWDDANSNGVSDYTERIVTVEAWSDYYAFGMLQIGRNFASESYRASFQGQEADHEIYGVGNSVNYRYRIHAPRLGRFFAVDPLAPKYPHNSPYAFSENVVINAVELEGLEKMTVIHRQGEDKKWSKEYNKTVNRYGYGEEGVLHKYYNSEGEELKWKSHFVPSKAQKIEISKWMRKDQYCDLMKCSKSTLNYINNGGPSDFEYTRDLSVDTRNLSKSNNFVYRMPEFNTYRLKQVNIIPELITWKLSMISGDTEDVEFYSSKDLKAQATAQGGIGYDIYYNGELKGHIDLMAAKKFLDAAWRLNDNPNVDELRYAASLIVFYESNPNYNKYSDELVDIKTDAVWMEKFVKAAFIHFVPKPARDTGALD